MLDGDCPLTPVRNATVGMSMALQAAGMGTRCLGRVSQDCGVVGVDVGVVRSIYRFPVKSMLGESLERAVIDGGGVAGDRQYALVDDESGKVVSVKRPK